MPTFHNLNNITLPLACVAAISPAAAQLLAGPLVGHTTPSSAQIWAHAGSGKTVEIAYGPANATAAQLITRSMPPRSDFNHTSLIELTGLSTATDYRYEIRVNGTTAKSGTFTTAPALHQPAKFSYALASCMSYQLFQEQPAWTTMQAQNAAFNILHGDNVYADTTNAAAVWRRYTQQRSVANHAAIIANAPTYAIWDDHDYGPNDSDGTLAGKAESLRTFKQLWANPAYGTATIPGVFHTFTWGNVQFFMLDDRYHRTPDDATDNNAKTQFGIDQRNWLLAELKKSKATFKVIVNGTVFVSLGKYSSERKIIADYINANKIYGVIYHVGDAHRVQIKVEDHGQGYPMVEIMSSGIAKVPSRAWAMIDVDTTVADPVLSYRFFQKEVQTDTQAFRLSTLTKAGVNDLILSSPVGGEKLTAGATHPIKWTRVGTGNTSVTLEYTTGSIWKTIATGVANNGNYSWTVPAENSTAVKVRVRSADATIADESTSAFTIAPATTPPPAAVNLALNPSFEQGGNAPTSWTLAGSAIGTNESAQAGSRSLKIATAGTNSPTTQAITLQIGKTYHLSVWINAAQMTSGKAVCDTNDRYDGNGQGQFVMNSANAGWTKYSGTFTATAAALTLRIFTDRTFAGSVYFDNIELTESKEVSYNSWLEDFFPNITDSAKIGFTADPDADQLANGLEFILGGDPTRQDSTSVLPRFYREDDHYLFSYSRSAASENTTTQLVQYGHNLRDWTDVMIGDGSGSSGGTTYTVTAGNPHTVPDTIVFTIPYAGTDKVFARLKASLLVP